MSKNENIFRLLDVSTFLEERPAMSAFGENEIQEGILTAFNLINGECANLPYKVLEYNLKEERDTKHELYRNEFEMDQFKQAIVTQTQYTLNMGNDFSQGSSTFSSGGVSASIQRPEKRDILAPGVVKFLTNARLYVLQMFNGTQKPLDNKKCDNPYLTYTLGDSRYVQKYQDSANVGSVCVIDNSKMVSFVDPNDITFKSYEADKILDRDGQYKFIQDINNLAFYGPNGTDAITHNEALFSIRSLKVYDKNFTYESGDLVYVWENDNLWYRVFKSNIDNNLNHDPILDNAESFYWTELFDHNVKAKYVFDPKEQVFKMINEFDIHYFDGLTKQEIYNAISASGTTWQATLKYTIDFVVIFVNSKNVLEWYKSKANDNIGNNPETSPEFWEKLPMSAIDVNDVINQIRPEVERIVNESIDKKLEAIKEGITVDYANELFAFESEEQFNEFIANTPKFEATDFENVSLGEGTNGVYKKLKKNILANAFIDFPQTEVGQDLIRIERKADINTNEINKTNANVANNTQAIEELKPQVQTNQESIEQINQELDTCAKLEANNTFIQDNTFKKVFVKGTNNNNNYVLLDNFDWNNKNYSVVKLVKSGTNNLLQLEAVNNDNSVVISAPSATSFHINNLSNPTQNKQAANKEYVDGLIKKRRVNVSEFGDLTQFSNNGMRFNCKNKNLNDLSINYQNVVNVKWVNIKTAAETTFSWCVYENNWMELKFLHTKTGVSYNVGGYVEIYYI